MKKKKNKVEVEQNNSTEYLKSKIKVLQDQIEGLNQDRQRLLTENAELMSRNNTLAADNYKLRQQSNTQLEEELKKSKEESVRLKKSFKV